MTSTTTEPQRDSAIAQPKFSLGRFAQTYGIFLVFILLCIVLTSLKPTFATPNNLLNVLRQVSINGVLAIGMTLVIISGGIDLSVGSLVALTGVVTAGFIRDGTNIALAICIGIACSAILGVINGIFSSRWRLAPFIVTLAMMTVARGLTFIYSDGQPISGLPQAFLFIGKGNIELGSLAIPLPALILIVFFIIFQLMLTHTSFGRYIYAVGGNEHASVVSGINANLVKTAVYTLCGLMAGIASIILTARVAVGLPQAGQGYELDAIAAVVIGGTSLSGGKGRLWGTMVGALILGVLSNGLDLLGVGSFYQQIIKGLIILAAVLLDAGRKNK
jgi:ribose/xylose/arabinose/galactoside ABC-type transport system permease subunit